MMIKTIFGLLLKEFGQQGWWPINGKYHPGDYSYPRNEQEKLEIIQGAILTQNTAWKNVEKALENIKEVNIGKIDKNKLASLIKSAGYFNQKAERLKIVSEFFKCNKNPSREELLNVKGVGPETADSILLYAFNQPYFVTDAYTRRIFSRLGICNENVGYDELQQIFYVKLDKDYKLFNEYHALLVEHAKVYCRKKPLCEKCPLNRLCKYYKKSTIS